MKIKAIIFDLDGTILDTKSLIIKALNKTFKALSVKIEEYDFSKYLYFSSMDDYLEAVIHKTEYERISIIKNYYINYYNKNCVGHAKPYVGISLLLKKLECDFKLLIATSKFTSCAKAELAEHKLDKNFTLIQGSDPGVLHKPHPYMLEKFSQHLNLSPNEFIMIGDTGNDVLFGKNFGTSTIAVTYGIWEKENFLKQNIVPNHFVDTVEELYLKIHFINSEISRRF